MTISEFLCLGRVVQSTYTEQLGYIEYATTDICGNIMIKIRWNSGGISSLELSNEEDINIFKEQKVLAYLHILDLCSGDLMCQLHKCKSQLSNYSILPFDY